MWLVCEDSLLGYSYTEETIPTLTQEPACVHEQFGALKKTVFNWFFSKLNVKRLSFGAKWLYEYRLCTVRPRWYFLRQPVRHGVVFFPTTFYILYYYVPCFPPILSIAILCVQVNAIGHENIAKSCSYSMYRTPPFKTFSAAPMFFWRISGTGSIKFPQFLRMMALKVFLAIRVYFHSYLCTRTYKVFQNISHE